MNIENQINISSKLNMRKLIVIEFIILLCGTIFAWGNFIFELISYINNKPCKTGCSANFNQFFEVEQTQTLTNPFLTSCFYGAIFFTIALFIIILILKKYKKSSNI
ncbi:MAG: hypothetical protein PHH83_01430 [Patescibacteria group bacterium]|nr:hypothetical protein [Patescibacteria group bacterium]